MSTSLSENVTLVPASITFGSTTVLPDEDGVAPTAAPTLERYSVIAEIGRGGVGSVLAATDRDIGRRVAIKRMLTPYTRSRQAVNRFVREVRTVGRLDHPNIVPLHDVGRDPQGDYFFVMKLLEGTTLESIIGRLRNGDPEAHRRWTFARRTELFVQILQAMRFAHDKGIVHRDLKPANIMVGDHGEVHVVDWGLAKPIDGPELPDDPTEAPEAPAQTQAGALVGTPRYMAPEQARGERVDTRTDTWQLSLLFYELLALSHYLDGIDTVPAMLDGVQKRTVPSPRALRKNPHQDAVPADLAWFVMQGLDRDPNGRYPDAGAMLRRLEMRADGVIPIDCPATAQKVMLHRMDRLIDRHPLVMLAFTTVILGTGVASILIGFLGLVFGVIAGIVL